MIHWRDDGFVLSVRRHGESAAIVSLLTRTHGRHVGLVRGGAGRRQRGVLQTGNRVAAHWRARLAEQLGAYRCELVRAHAAGLLTARLPLLALAAAAALADETLPEREPQAEAFDRFDALLDALRGPDWAAAYVRWEIDLLALLGFGLDLSACAATGATEGLRYVSPRSGRAVSAAAGARWRPRLLPLPGFLTDSGPDPDALPGRGEVNDGLRLAGHFLQRHALAPQGRRMPGPRLQLVDALAAATTISGGLPGGAPS